MITKIIIVALVTWIITDLIFRLFKKPDAVLNVDTSDPKTDHYNLIFFLPLEEVSKQKNLNVKVKTDVRK